MFKQQADNVQAKGNKNEQSKRKRRHVVGADEDYIWFQVTGSHLIQKRKKASAIMKEKT